MIPRSRLLRAECEVIRRTGARNYAGEFRLSVESSTSHFCATSPESGVVRDLGEEGARRVGDRVFWLAESADVSSGGDDHLADVIQYDGEEFRVVEVKLYRGSHQRVTADRVEGE